MVDRAKRKMGKAPLSSDESKATADLRRFIEENAHSLLPILRSYIAKARLVPPDSVTEATHELLGEVVVEALKSAESFDIRSRSPRPWLLKIAANLVSRKQAERFRRKRRESHVRDQNFGSQDSTAGARSSENRSDAEFFDQIAARIIDGKIRPTSKTDWARPFFNPEILDEMIGDENAEALLTLVSDQDREVLTLAVIHCLDGKALAQALKIKHGAARARLHRALNNLRTEVSKRQLNMREQ